MVFYQNTFKTLEDNTLLSKLELLFLLDSGASICVLHAHTCTILADHFPERSKSTPQNTDF